MNHRDNFTFYFCFLGKAFLVQFSILVASAAVDVAEALVYVNIQAYVTSTLVSIRCIEKNTYFLTNRCILTLGVLPFHLVQL
jgi:hypothetical protein